MDLLITAIAFVVIFSLLILVHEWGHFAAARKSGIKVEEFGMGLPPRAWGKKKGETIYSLNWIPLGGFVRLLGEDAKDPKMRKNKQSFAAKSPLTRLFVVVAGVLMNFVLAIVLLTIGFTFGIEPLILDYGDFMQQVEQGNVVVEPAVKIADVVEGSPADMAGLKKDDQVMALDGQTLVAPEQIQMLLEGHDEMMQVTVVRDGQEEVVSIVPVEGGSAGIGLYPAAVMPYVGVSGIQSGSIFEQVGLQSGDIIMAIDGVDLRSPEDYYTALRGKNGATYTVLRGGQIFDVEILFGSAPLLIISGVIPGGAAAEAGLESGDLLAAVGEQAIFSFEELLTATAELRAENTLPLEPIVYTVVRDGEPVDIPVMLDEQGMAGIMVANIEPAVYYGMDLYQQDVTVSILDIAQARYPVWEAPFQAVSETGRLSVFTLGMFGNVMRQLFTEFTVPDGVAGPVGIAQMTYVFAQEGLLSLLRFMALLSISLGVINLFPFPALDGGRAFFILVEMITRRPLSGKFEHIVHGLGFVLLIGMLLFITFGDVMRLLG